MKETTRNNDEWVRCKNCGHKLFKNIDVKGTVEIKCHSCKKINIIKIEEENRRNY